jgi:branched-chain amino acid aminotransferase
MSIATLDLKITKTARSRAKDQDVNNVAFGKYFSDHMFVANYKDGKWDKGEIIPYGDVPMSYAMSALHYGQAIFEGMKAFKQDDGEVVLFRPLANHKRLNRSAIRMAMPEVPEELFMTALNEIVKIDSDWIPTSDKGSLYLRPFLIATDEAIGVRPSDNYQFVVICAPAGVYYSEPIKVKVETNYFRAVEGGVGFVKAAGNYGRSMYPTKLAQEKGFQQVIWTDARDHKYVEESGTMNLMFVIDNQIVTPALGDTILAGVTRESVLMLARFWGYHVEERRISVDELVQAHAKGKLQEAFGVGTAATVAQIIGIGVEDKILDLPPIEGRVFSNKVDGMLRDIRKGRVEDTFNWMVKVQ